MILVVGATGVLGGEITRRLLENGKQVRALVRTSSRKSGALEAAGARLFPGDLLDVDSVTAACRGVESVVTTASCMSSQNPNDSFESVDRDGQMRLLAAAEAARVRRFVFVSSPESYDSSPLQAAKLAVESRLRTSAMPHVILRPSFLMDVWLSPALGFDYVEGRVRIYGDGKPPIAWVAVADVARAAHYCLEALEAVGKTLDIGGPSAVSPNDVISTFERISGRRFISELLQESVLRAQYASALDPRQRAFFAVALQYAQGHVPPADALPTSMPRPQIDVASYAKQVLQRTL